MKPPDAVMPKQDHRHEAFLELFLEHQPRIYAYIRSLGLQKADADDIMQETANVLWRKFDDFEKGTHFDRLALRTAYFQVRCFRQKKARESQKLQFSDEALEVLAKDAEELTDSTEEVAEALQRCLLKLPTKDRQMVTLRFAPGGTNRAVSKKIGKSETVVSRTLSRIYNSLMRCVNLQVKFEGKVG